MTEKTKILLVDDEPDILEFISYNLTKEDFEVFTSNNGRDAIKIAIKEKPDLKSMFKFIPIGFAFPTRLRDTCISLSGLV